MRLDGARMISIRSPRLLGSVPAQPSACTLLTSWPVSFAAGACGRFSSSRTRTGNNVVARQTERRARLFLRHRRELLDERAEGLSPPSR